mmetsp:Transcript_81822/g.264158  ORF Transcript_81822/g.264158 Transcript_81822/m.264158 type:complete len:857 (+) Transcript_81822:220-2790(+)
MAAAAASPMLLPASRVFYAEPQFAAGSTPPRRPALLAARATVQSTPSDFSAFSAGAVCAPTAAAAPRGSLQSASGALAARSTVGASAPSRAVPVSVSTRPTSGTSGRQATPQVARSLSPVVAPSTSVPGMSGVRSAPSVATLLFVPVPVPFSYADLDDGAGSYPRAHVKSCATPSRALGGGWHDGPTIVGGKSFAVESSPRKAQVTAASHAPGAVSEATAPGAQSANTRHAGAWLEGVSTADGTPSIRVSRASCAAASVDGVASLGGVVRVAAATPSPTLQYRSVAAPPESLQPLASSRVSLAAPSHRAAASAFLENRRLPESEIRTITAIFPAPSMAVSAPIEGEGWASPAAYAFPSEEHVAGAGQAHVSATGAVAASLAEAHQAEGWASPPVVFASRSDDHGLGGTTSRRVGDTSSHAAAAPEPDRWAPGVPSAARGPVHIVVGASSVVPEASPRMLHEAAPPFSPPLPAPSSPVPAPPCAAAVPSRMPRGQTSASASEDIGHPPSSTAGASVEAPKVVKIVKYRCPACSEMVDSVDEALAHCGQPDASAGVGAEQGQTGDATRSQSADSGAKKVVGAQALEPDASAMPKGEAVAYDDAGRPSIVRQVDEETGVARTIVMNEDGTKRVFGKNTIDSLANSDMDTNKTWAEGLSAHHMRGLVHEVGQRLLEGSRTYHSRLEELEKLGEKLNFMYFGLKSEATEKEVDNAYRQLARKMHPDKNGGTEAAKEKFQGMKERYESLKKNFQSQEEEPKKEEQDEEEKPKQSEDEGEGEADGDRKKSDAEESEGAEADQKGKKKKKKGTSIEYDPKDKDSMVKTVTKMVKQLKNIEIQMEVLVKELKRAQSSLPSDFKAA